MTFLVIMLVVVGYFIALIWAEESITKYKKKQYAQKHFSQTERYRRGIR